MQNGSSRSLAVDLPGQETVVPAMIIQNGQAVLWPWFCQGDKDEVMPVRRKRNIVNTIADGTILYWPRYSINKRKKFPNTYIPLKRFDIVRGFASSVPDNLGDGFDVAGLAKKDGLNVEHRVVSLVSLRGQFLRTRNGLRGGRVFWCSIRSEFSVSMCRAVLKTDQGGEHDTYGMRCYALACKPIRDALVRSSFVGGLKSGIGIRRYIYSGPLLTIIP